MTCSPFASFARTLMIAWPMDTRAARSMGLPYEWRMPLDNRSAPAQGKHLVLSDHVEGMSPRANVVGLLAAHLDEVLVAGDARRLQKALDEICSFSSDTKWATEGNWSTDAFLLPQSKMRIFGSGTPLQYAT